MTQETAKARIEELREQIDYHSRRYYDQDAPEIEDDEFDALTRELKELEQNYPQLAPSLLTLLHTVSDNMEGKKTGL